MIEILEDISDIIFGNKRLDTYRHFAQQKGFSLKRKHNPEVMAIDVLSMQLLKESRKKRAIKGLIYKRENQLEALAQIFDLIYYGDLGKKTTTVYLFENNDMVLPRFIIKPKSSFSKIGSIFTSSDWSYVDREFANKFNIETDDINAMQLIMTVQFAEVMLKLKDYVVEGIGHHLAIYKRHHSTDIIDMDNVYNESLEILDIILHDHSEEMI